MEAVESDARDAARSGVTAWKPSQQVLIVWVFAGTLAWKLLTAAYDAAFAGVVVLTMDRGVGQYVEAAAADAHDAVFAGS